MTDRVDAFCSLPAYQEHLMPILDAIPDELRGRLYAPDGVCREIQQRGVPCERGYAPSPSSAPVLVAGAQDLVFGRRPKVLCNHGSGQKYVGVESPSFAGGPGREMAELHIVPRQELADLEIARYPRARAVAVGAPKLDAWQKVPKPQNPEPVVAVTFHWPAYTKTVDGIMVPETGNAWKDWRDTIERLAKRRPVLGHSHPRFARDLRGWWESIGVEWVPNAQDLLSRADILALDNSSIGYEWSACDRPTVWLRGAEWSDTKHGLRFGEELPGPELEAGASVEQLDATISYAMADAWSDVRRRVSERVYGPDYNDGRASGRAAAAVLDLMG